MITHIELETEQDYHEEFLYSLYQGGEINLFELEAERQRLQEWLDWMEYLREIGSQIDGKEPSSSPTVAGVEELIESGVSSTTPRRPPDSNLFNGIINNGGLLWILSLPA